MAVPKVVQGDNLRGRKK